MNPWHAEMTMLTLTRPKSPSPISDLAAGLTDLTLELLSKAGVRGDSVEMELETWRALTDEIEREFDLLETRSSFEDEFNLSGMIQLAVHRAAVRVAGEFDPERSPAEIAAHLRPGVASLRVPRGRHAALQPRPRASRRPLGRSGVVRRLQLTALN
jgi:hypothetical protein